VTWNWSDTSTLNPTACPTSTTSQGDGIITLVAACTDPAGNTATAHYEVHVDTTTPTVGIYPLPAKADVANVQVRLNGSDTGSGIATYSLRVSATPINQRNANAWTQPAAFQSITTPTALLPVTSGNKYCVQAISTDNAGNASDWSAAQCTTITPARSASLQSPSTIRSAHVIYPSKKHARISWTKPSNDGGTRITSYSYCLTACTRTGSWHRTAATATSVVIGGLIKGHQYAVKVVAQNAVGKSSVTVIRFRQIK
jgi:hypothetical protein